MVRMVVMVKMENVVKMDHLDLEVQWVLVEKKVNKEIVDVKVNQVKKENVEKKVIKVHKD
ncbi:MAG: hypothetical protein EBZ77_16065 [Chitinophagia bacterium]|nr:hypothetical protein [Chitinophagia bacterium]